MRVGKVAAFPLLNDGAGAPHTPGKGEAPSDKCLPRWAVKTDRDKHHYCPRNPQSRNRRLLSAPAQAIRYWALWILSELGW